MQPIINYFSKLRRFTKLDERKRYEYLFQPLNTFVRDSPLTFTRTVSFILDLARQSLAVELARFFKFKPQKIVSKSAFCQRRQAIKPKFFQDFFEQTYRNFYTSFKDHQRWKGKRLMAVDGTGQKLPNENWIGEAFGFHQNQHDNRPSTRILLTHDLLNDITIKINFHTQKSAEIIHAYQNVADLPTDAIYIYDRGFKSYGLAHLHYRAGSDFIIRMPLTGSSEVENFAESTDKERIVTMPVKGRTKSTIRSLGIQLDRSINIKVRLVKVQLSTGETEILMTSLLDRVRYPHGCFKWLYGMRWGVETAIYVLKSFLQLALCSAYTQPGVEQDLWATLAFYNQQSAIRTSVKEDIEKKTEHRKYTYRMNRNVTAGIIQEFVYHIYLDGASHWRARTRVLLKLCADYTEPYRPRKGRQRTRKIMRAQHRHTNEKNYRKAM